MPPAQQQLEQRLTQHLQRIYAGVLQPQQLSALKRELLATIGQRVADDCPPTHANLWSEADVFVITYADTVLADGQKPLATLKEFLDKRFRSFVNSVHILPFFPYSSDDGFAVIDYSSVNEAHGDWRDIENIARDYHLMSDLVINHCSSRSLWFQNFIKGRSPGAGYFFTANKDDDLSEVIRPRSSELLRETETASGTEYVWCTFSHDQVDFDFRNPAVLIEFLRIIFQYLDSGIRIFRMDAIAFVWKVVGSNCLNLQQTHEMVRLFRTVIELCQPDAIILTETNIPTKENLDYFGNANEAHWVYNFALPPLLIYTLVSGNSKHLKQWLMSMPPAQNGTAYFNFIASHDGVGLRPVEGILNETEIQNLLNAMLEFGGRVSWRSVADGTTKPYEINISLLDALSGSLAGQDDYGKQRFICAHAIMFALEGIPAVYFHSFVATSNDNKKVELTGQNRSINRHQWDAAELNALLDDPDSIQAVVSSELERLLVIRKQQSAFHPNATQFTLQLPPSLFGFWRQSIDRRQSIFCICNISSDVSELLLTELNLIITDDWHDLVSGTSMQKEGSIQLAPYQVLWITNVVATN